MKLTVKTLKKTPEVEWKKALQNYILTEIAPRILPLNDSMENKQIQTIKKMRSIMSGDEAMKVWVPAFTHASYDSMVDKNFEIYEYMGDKMLSYALGVYMKKKYPESNEDHLNNFDTYFTSKKPLAEISIQTKMINHVRTIKKLSTTKEISDIFESVIGAITKIGDELISPGVGYMIAYNYIASVYNWYDFKKKTRLTSNVNKVMQGYYDNLGWREKKQSNKFFEDWDLKTKTLTLYLNDKAIKMLKKMGNPPKNIFMYQGRQRAVLAQNSGPSEKEARDGLYLKALQVLRKTYKITPELTKFLKILRDLNKISQETKLLNRKDVNSMYNNIKTKMDHDGYVELKIRNYETEVGTMFVLQGIKADDLVEIISRAVFKNVKDSIYSSYYLYKAYVENGRMKNDFSYYVF